MSTSKMDVEQTEAFVMVESSDFYQKVRRTRISLYEAELLAMEMISVKRPNRCR